MAALGVLMLACAGLHAQEALPTLESGPEFMATPEPDSDPEAAPMLAPDPVDAAVVPAADTTTTPAIQPVATPQATGEQAEVTATSLNVRAGPSTQGQPLDSLPRGTRVTLTGGQVRSWREVILPDGRRGWVGGRYLRPVTAPAPVPSPTPAPTAIRFCPPGREGVLSVAQGLRIGPLDCTDAEELAPGRWQAVNCARSGVLLLGAVTAEVSGTEITFAGLLEGTAPLCP